MASLLDFSFFSFLKPLFTFLFVFILLYAIAYKTNFFGNAFLNLAAAFVVAFLFIVMPGVSDLISIAAPWYVILIVVISLILVIFMFVGVGGEAISGVFQQSWMIWLIVIIVIVGIFGYAATKTFGSDVQGLTQEQGGEDVTKSIGQILFSPKLLGALFILVVAAQAIRLISGGK
ncbi:MAG: hypothetical protein PHG05_01135 [Candidatus Nanoarchaeia archaeon]|nr:hypothetical protein [Candidatus Nanoarchaeia archaeon]